MDVRGVMLQPLPDTRHGTSACKAGTICADGNEDQIVNINTPLSTRNWQRRDHYCACGAERVNVEVFLSFSSVRISLILS